MPEHNKYPRFIWVIVGIILLAVVAYAIFTEQEIETIKMPGGELTFRTKPKNQEFSFIVSYSIGRAAVEGLAALYVDGKKAASLHADNNRPNVTATVNLPTPGQYSYRLEETAIEYVTDSDDKQIQVRYEFIGGGRINIQPGDAFIVGRNYLIGQDRPTTVELELRRISEKE